MEAAFQGSRVRASAIDILVNNVWGGYERMIDNGEFTWMKPFWEQPLWRWDAMFGAGVARALSGQSARRAGHDRARPRAHRQHLALGCAEAPGQRHVRCVEGGDRQDDRAYGRQAQPHGVAVVSLYPGMVRTEKVMEAAAWLDLSNSESPEFVGRAVAALAGGS